ncbi:lysine N(6)-hydroxylase/L-ornithine N(5)-oxygenase family protein [Marinococcus luteus]|uniref:lysine N(6)-hydroxylase/L-ornithine N(5)-oxygenase family protein n=1 Tax=Marinococcus luteus TaxID=1122204 RepID=UPI002ACD091C|nr:lysine N(6)-hydroxylase/L-ornithine N(5)-oxygenase family protein [Marinococcus luteus]MDZ5783269.1 lysine N(6)-hydroxylase/L-ornithine N(5)-oxygenase family protein [Marinococcus luteus]
MTEEIYDVVGIGIGPFNLGMAALVENVPEVNGLFLDENDRFEWHGGMLLDGTSLQVPFLADLVTLADPKSPYSFLQYLQEKERLYHFYFYEKFHIPRREYNDYCRWAAEKLSSCRFGQRVVQVDFLKENGLYKVETENTVAGKSECFYSRHVVMGTGTTPALPSWMEKGRSVCHSADYRYRRNELLQKQSITVAGSGQSAAEVFLDLLKNRPEYGFSLRWYTRSSGFFPMEYSKLGLEHFSPDYTSYFYHLDPGTKEELLQKQDLLYKGISADTIAAVYDELYEQTIGGESRDIVLQANTELTSMESTPAGDIKLFLKEVNYSTEYTEETEALIAATGYQPSPQPFLKGIEAYLQRDERGRLQIDEKYRAVQAEKNRHVFIQNGEMHTHGVGAPDLGLGAHRNAVIINQIANRDVYPVRSENVFQQFKREKAGVIV